MAQLRSFSSLLRVIFWTVVAYGDLIENEMNAGLFIFGDSTVDVGTNSYINTTVENRANYVPYGNNGFFSAPTGRFSNGRIAPDFIAERAKIPPIPPFLQPHADFSYGANFASGGAGVLSETKQGLVVDLKTQVAQFLDLKKNVSQQLGFEKATRWFVDSVYYLSIGSNDYLVGYLNDARALEHYTPNEFRQLVIGNLSAVIQDKLIDYRNVTIHKLLYGQGARKFLIAAVADLGCLPGTRLFSQTNSCFEIATNLSTAHNTALEELLVDLSKLHGFKYTFFDLAGFLSSRSNDPLKYGAPSPSKNFPLSISYFLKFYLYHNLVLIGGAWTENGEAFEGLVIFWPGRVQGFVDGISACCGSGALNGMDTCGGKNGAKDYNLCEHAASNVWFDAYHSTEQLHKQVVESMWEGKDSFTRPIPLQVLFEAEGFSCSSY